MICDGSKRDACRGTPMDQNFFNFMGISGKKRIGVKVGAPI